MLSGQTAKLEYRLNIPACLTGGRLPDSGIISCQVINDDLVDDAGDMNTTLQHNLGLVEASITNLTCTQNQNGNDTVHAVHWNANGCIKGRTFITFENRWGESVRLQANEGVDRVDRVETNEIQGISVVRVHPEFNLNGDVGQLTSCGEDFVPPERTTSKIYPDSISIINFISRTAISHTTANWLSFGRTFQVYIPAIPGSRLHLVAKLGYTNDYFIGFEDEGLPLFDGDNQAVYSQFAVITHHLRLFDAGTEVDQKPGLGSYQANNTGGPADPLNYVRYASNPYANLPSSISDIVFLDIAPVYSRDGDLEQFKVQMIGNKALAQRSSNPGCD